MSSDMSLVTDTLGQGRIRRGSQGSYGYPCWDTKYKEREEEKKRKREKGREKERKGNVFFIILIQIFIN